MDAETLSSSFHAHFPVLLLQTLVNTPAIHAVAASIIFLSALAPLSSLCVLSSGALLLLSLHACGIPSVSPAAEVALSKLGLTHPTRAQLLAAATTRTPPTTPLLPPLSAHMHAKRLTVVLDLDETLLVALRLRCLPPSQQARHLSTPTPNQLQVTCSVVPGVTERLLVYVRPGLGRFLDELASFAEVVLFTASLQAYAEPLVRAIDPAGSRFSSVLYRPSTVPTAQRDYIKDLHRLGRDVQRLVLVDNNPWSFLLQPLNGIPVDAYMGCPEDAYLLQVLLPLLRGLAHLDDVRPVLESKYNMPAWFAQEGVDVGAVANVGGLHRISVGRLAYAPGGTTAFEHDQ